VGTHWDTEASFPKHAERAIGVIIKGIVERPGLTQDQISTELTELAKYISIMARMDELERVRAATLDAENDVWSITDEGEIVSLNDRVEELDGYA
jgi:hypothetical protein